MAWAGWVGLLLMGGAAALMPVLWILPPDGQVLVFLGLFAGMALYGWWYRRRPQPDIADPPADRDTGPAPAAAPSHVDDTAPANTETPPR
jgi:hypothetical protein